MELLYNRLEHCSLFDFLKNKDISQSLVYMVAFKEYANLKVVYHPYSIEVSNDSITIIIILLIGFELKEYDRLKGRNNVHLVSFNYSCQEVFQFEKFKTEIKQLNFDALFYTILSRSESKEVRDLYHLKILNVFYS